MNLVDDVIEVRRDPDAVARCYRTHVVVGRGARLAVVALPDAAVSADDLLPPPGYK